MLQKLIVEAVELLQLRWKNQRALSLAVAEMLKARLGVIQVVIGYTDVRTGTRQKLLLEEPEDLELFNDFNPSVERCVAARASRPQGHARAAQPLRHGRLERRPRRRPCCSHGSAHGRIEGHVLHQRVPRGGLTRVIPPARSAPSPRLGCAP